MKNRLKFYKGKEDFPFGDATNIIAFLISGLVKPLPLFSPCIVWVSSRGEELLLIHRKPVFATNTENFA